MSFVLNHELPDSNEHYTPAWLFRSMGIIFDLDVAAPEGGIEWIPAKKSYSIKDDGLTSPWQGRVWMNPPFSKPAPWVEKFIAHNNGIALLVVSRSQWFRDLWETADAIMPTPYNLKFERPDGIAKAISFQTFLFAFGEENVQGFRNLSSQRIR
jgi:hypothetical protein